MQRSWLVVSGAPFVQATQLVRDHLRTKPAAQLRVSGAGERLATRNECHEGTIPEPNLRALSDIENRLHFVFAGCPEGNGLRDGLLV